MIRFLIKWMVAENSKKVFCRNVFQFSIFSFENKFRVSHINKEKKKWFHTIVEVFDTNKCRAKYELGIN